jgi:hypothetical protein
MVHLSPRLAGQSRDPALPGVLFHWPFRLKMPRYRYSSFALVPGVCPAQDRSDGEPGQSADVAVAALLREDLGEGGLAG